MGDPERRTSILQAASRLLRHYGPFKTTVADIAREARVGVGTVYLEFRSKDAILQVLAGRHHAQVLEAERRAWEGSRGPAGQRLAQVLDARFEAFGRCAEDGAHGADLFCGACPAIERAHRRFIEAERAFFAELLRAGADRGELAVDDPAADARALLDAYCSYAPPMVFARPLQELRRDLSRIHRLVLSGLLPR